jgi:hypothetical protein
MHVLEEEHVCGRFLRCAGLIVGQVALMQHGNMCWVPGLLLQGLFVVCSDPGMTCDWAVTAASYCC